MKQVHAGSFIVTLQNIWRESRRNLPPGNFVFVLFCLHILPVYMTIDFFNFRITIERQNCNTLFGNAKYEPPQRQVPESLQPQVGAA